MSKQNIAYTGLAVLGLSLASLFLSIFFVVFMKQELFESLNSVDIKFLVLLITLSALSGLGLLLCWVFFEPTISRAALGMLRVFLSAFSAAILLPPSFLGLKDVSARAGGENLFSASFQESFSQSALFILVTGVLAVVAFREFKGAKVLQFELKIRTDI